MTLKNKRVLVTGADGFIGSHLVESLLQEGCSVRALALYNSFNSWGWLDEIPELGVVEVITGDVRDPFLCRKITKDIDVVFHLAALIAIPYSYLAPNTYVETNINGTLNMLQAAMDNHVSHFIHTSTSEVYGTAKYVPIDENHPLQPQSPYSASKIGADSLALSYFNSFQMPVTVARPFNTYGPRQSARAVIPSIICQIAAGAKKISLGDTTPTRDFNYVKDTCSGFVQIAECSYSIGKTINIGSGTEISVLDLLSLIKKMMGSDVELVKDDQRIRPEKSEVFRLVCDNRLLTSLTDFKVQHTLEEGLKHSIDWFLKNENLKKYKAHLYNV